MLLEVHRKELCFMGSFTNKDITLHDTVMMDDPRTEELLDKVYNQWQLAYSMGENTKTIAT